MLKLGVSLANSFANYFNTLESNGWIDIYSGTPPTNADDPTSDTILASIHLPLIAFAAASGGVITLQGTWFATAYASGTAAWFRFRDASGTNHLIGSISTGGSDPLILNTTTFVTGGVVQITSCTITIPLS